MTTRDNAERNDRALELHLAGVSYSRIAEALGLRSKSAAHDAVQSALARRGDPAPAPEPDPTPPGQGPDVPATVATELGRLDAMLTGLWPRARQGDVKAVDRVLKIGERRMALLTLAARSNPAPEAEPATEGEGVPRVANIAAARARRLAEAEGLPPS